MASGSQMCSGNCADLPIAPMATNTAAAVTPGTRSVADDAKATYLPSALTDGLVLSELACAPLPETLTRSVVGPLARARLSPVRIASTASNAAITRAIVALAHSLNLGVIAEGVETVEQLEYLRSLACNEGQGYLFSYPLSADDSLRLLAEKRNFDRDGHEVNGTVEGFWIQRGEDFAQSATLN